MAHVLYKPEHKLVNNIVHMKCFKTEYFIEAMNYKPIPGDVFVVSFPKCGTHWMECIATHILRKGKELDNPRDWFGISPHIDVVGIQGINRMPRPGAFMTHLTYNMIPYSPDAKYINVYRNPKDCCVSTFNFYTSNIGFGYSQGKFDDFFELFMAGETMYNSYFDHLMSWYPHRNDNNVFFTTYEDIKKDRKGIILKLAKFLGDEYMDAIIKDNNVLNNILHFSSFEYMKRVIMDVHDFSVVTDEQLEDPNLLDGVRYFVKYLRSFDSPDKKLHVVRKGEVGDWRNYFNDEQSERMNKKFFEVTQGTEIQEKFKYYM